MYSVRPARPRGREVAQVSPVPTRRDEPGPRHGLQVGTAEEHVFERRRAKTHSKSGCATWAGKPFATLLRASRPAYGRQGLISTIILGSWVRATRGASSDGAPPSSSCWREDPIERQYSQELGLGHTSAPATFRAGNLLVSEKHDGVAFGEDRSDALPL